MTELCPKHYLINSSLEDIKRSLENMENSLLGTNNNPGFGEKVRTLEKDVKTLKEEEIRRVQEEIALIKERSSFWRDKRLVFMVAVFSALTGSVSSWILRLLDK